MTLQRFKPFGEMQTLQNRVNRLFDSFFNRDYDESGDLTTSWYPATNIYETKDDFVLKIDVPGMKSEDIHIEFKNGAIVISGERKEEKDIKREEFHRVETTYGKFSRSFILPTRVNPDKISADLKEGVLEIQIAKSDEAKPKSIKINVG